MSKQKFHYLAKSFSIDDNFYIKLFNYSSGSNKQSKCLCIWLFASKDRKKKDYASSTDKRLSLVMH